MKIVALTASYNRVKKTKSALQSIISQKLPKNSFLDIFVVDNRSNDGTDIMIKSSYPKVNLIKTNSNLFWAQSMLFGWDTCIKHMKFDYLLTFNDDIKLKNKFSLMKIFDECSKANDLAIVSGVFVNSVNEIVYGGFIANSKINPLKLKKIKKLKIPNKADAVNMNFTIIPNTILKKINFLDKHFIHSMADIEFSYRLRKNGFSCLISRDVIGICQNNNDINYFKGLKFSNFKNVLHVKNQPFSARWRLYKSHGGSFWFVFFIGPYVKALLIDLVRLIK